MRGRPEKSPDERRTNILKVCLTDAERAELDDMADGKSSVWAREVLLKAIQKQKKGRARGR